MSNVRKDIVNAAYNKAYALINHDDIDIRFKSLKQYILDDKDLTNEEKSEAIKRFDGDHDYYKIIYNIGARRTCEYCQEKCLATLYCEFCMRNFLRKEFSNWTSGSKNIDELIQKCQNDSLIPYMTVEWVPYNSFQNIDYLARGGCSDIYTADWIVGCYKEWDSKEQRLKRSGTCKVVLKRLENVENANRVWLDEAITHLFISNKWGSIVQCYGLTKDPLNEKFMLVMNKMDIDLRNYLRENRGKISWRTKIKIIFEVIKAITRIHGENSIHRDLHSGNILFSQEKDDWYISDLGFCGPADKPLKSVYGNLPYIAPEVIFKNEYSFASDIYGIGVLMWEIAFEQPPFINHKHDYNLALNIINGIRPKIPSDTPSDFRDLMEQCWDSDPKKRPGIYALWYKVEEFNKLLHEDHDHWKNINSNFNLIPNINSLYENTNSKIFTFENVPKPKNATHEEQEAYYTSQYSLNIRDSPEDSD